MQIGGAAAASSLSGDEQRQFPTKWLFYWSRKRAEATLFGSLMASAGFERCGLRSVDGPTRVIIHSDVLHHTHHNVCLQLPLLWIIGLGDCGLRCVWPPRRVALVPSLPPQHPVPPAWIQDYTVSAEICLPPRHTSRQACNCCRTASMRRRDILTAFINKPRRCVQPELAQQGAARQSQLLPGRKADILNASVEKTI